MGSGRYGRVDSSSDCRAGRDTWVRLYLPVVEIIIVSRTHIIASDRYDIGDSKWI
jgi:hypothetical protein